MPSETGGERRGLFCIARHFSATGGWPLHSVTWLVPLLVIASDGLLAADREIPLAEAISVLDAQARRIKVVAWTVNRTSHHLSDPNQANSIVATLPDSISGTVTIDPVAKRYRADLQTVMRWVGEGVPAPHISEVQAWAFDGEIGRGWNKSKHGTTLPDMADKTDFPPKGTIQRGATDARWMDTWAFDTGHAYMPPCFWGVIWVVDIPSPAFGTLSDLLKRNQPGKETVSVTENAAARWKIRLLDHHSTSLVEVECDPAKGFAVVGATWDSHQAGTPYNKPHRQLEVDLVKVDGDFWMPSEIREIHPFEVPVGLRRFQFSNIKVNPPVDAGTFSLTFPTGCYVDDQVEKKYYQVGGGIIDEQAAVRAFMVLHRLDASAAIQTKPWWKRLWLWGAVALALGAVVWLVPRWRTKWTGIAIFWSLGLVGQMGVAGEYDSGGNWTVSHQPGERILVRQCGYTVTVFALERMGVPYDPKLVSTSLKATKDGIRLVDIQQVLAAHGLEVDARQDVTTKALLRALTNDNLAIFPLQMRDGVTDNHYFLGLLDRQGQATFVNVLIGSKPLSQAVDDDTLKKTKGLVLFVRKARLAGRPGRESVTVTPLKIDLGEFPTFGADAEKQRWAKVRIENVTSQAVLVPRVTASCGCTDLDWKGGVLQPGEVREVSVAIRPMAWGPGRKIRLVTFDFADGQRTAVEIQGEGLKPEDVQKLDVSPNEVHVEVIPTLGEQSTIHRTAALRLSGRRFDEVVVESNTSWLEARLIPSDDRSGEIDIVIKTTDDLAKQIAKSSETVEGLIGLKTDKHGPPVALKVFLHRKDFFTLSDRLIRLSSNRDSTGRITITPLGNPSRTLRVVELSCEAKALLLETVRQPDDSLHVEVKMAGPPSTGFHVVRAELESSLHEVSTATFVVQVAVGNATTTSAP
jgi:hypothetical protein